MCFQGVFVAGALVLACCAVILTMGCMEISEVPEDIGNVFLPSTPTPVPTPQPTTPSEIYAEGIVVPVSPYPTPVPTPELWAEPEPTATPAAEYHVIYRYDDALNYNVVAFDTVEPVVTLFFDYIIYPEMYTTSKGRVSNFEDKKSFVEILTRPNPNAFFDISVYDADSGLLVERRSHPTIISNPLRETFRIFSGGSFHVEITGGFVDANVTVSAPFAADGFNLTPVVPDTA